MTNYGFIPSKIESDQYILGGGMLSKIILCPDRNWKEWLDEFESQIEKGYETWGCVPWATQSAYQALFRRITGVKMDWSERFNYNISKIESPGSDPQKVSEDIRHYGLINEDLLPVPDTYAEFKTPRPMSETLLQEGRKFLNKYTPNHEWVFVNTPSKETRILLMREALQYSPVCVSVSAWYEQDGLYIDNGLPNSHWCLCYGVDDDGGLLIFDSYALVNNGVVTNAFKKLHPNHKCLMAKRYHLEPVTYQEKLNWIGKLLNWIAEQIGLLQKSSVLKPTNPVVPTFDDTPALSQRDLLNEFCLAIRDYEGRPGNLNYRLNNPGNLRSRTGPFLKFKTYEEGFAALKDYVTRAATGKHRAYKPDYNIVQFFRVYAPSLDNNNPERYANWICKRLRILNTTKIKDLL